MQLNAILITGEKLDFKVDKPTCVIGRSAQCDVVIPHESVSRKHCQVDYKDGELYVTDLGSINGVMIDGEKIEPNTPVKFQSFLTLSFGAVQTLHVDLPEERTSIQVNPLLTSSMQFDKKPLKPKPTGTSSVKPLPQKYAPKTAKELPKSTFIMITIAVVAVLFFFVFQEEILPYLE